MDCESINSTSKYLLIDNKNNLYSDVKLPVMEKLVHNIKK